MVHTPKKWLLQIETVDENLRLSSKMTVDKKICIFCHNSMKLRQYDQLMSRQYWSSFVNMARITDFFINGPFWVQLLIFFNSFKVTGNWNTIFSARLQNVNFMIEYFHPPYQNGFKLWLQLAWKWRHYDKVCIGDFNSWFSWTLRHHISWFRHSCAWDPIFY